jgi:hypothetical protein
MADSKVNINPTTQGLAYANIFLYDIQRNILLYEVNKFGCFQTVPLCAVGHDCSGQFYDLSDRSEDVR